MGQNKFFSILGDCVQIDPICVRGLDLNDKGVTHAWIANVTLGAAVLLGAAGAYLVISAPSTSTQKASRPRAVTVAASARVRTLTVGGVATPFGGAVMFVMSVDEFIKV